MLRDAANETALAQAHHVRESVGRAGRLVVRKIEERLGEDPPPDARELGSLSNALLAWWKVLCGQTGLVETTRTEVENQSSLPGMTMLEVLRELEKLSDEQLDTLDEWLDSGEEP